MRLAADDAPTPKQVTALLRAWSDGNERALEHLLPLVEAELRRLARIYMAKERLAGLAAGQAVVAARVGRQTR